MKGLAHQTSEELHVGIGIHVERMIKAKMNLLVIMICNDSPVNFSYRQVGIICIITKGCRLQDWLRQVVAYMCIMMSIFLLQKPKGSLASLECGMVE